MRISNESSGSLIGCPVYECSVVKSLNTHKTHAHGRSYTSLQSYGTYLVKLNIGSVSYCRHGWKIFNFPSLPNACLLLPNSAWDFTFQKGKRFCVETKNQLDVTACFIALMIRSTCFGHFYAHHQELETICVSLPPMVCTQHI